LAIDTGGLKGLDQMILADATDDARLATDVPTDRQIDLVPRKSLSNRDFV
jgi:hypothetical protein